MDKYTLKKINQLRALISAATALRNAADYGTEEQDYYNRIITAAYDEIEDLMKH